MCIICHESEFYPLLSYATTTIVNSATMSIGYNRYNLTTPVSVPKGALIYLQVVSGSILVDTSGSAQYPDFVVQSNAFTLLNPESNHILYFSSLVYTTYYESTYPLTYSYPSNGNMTIRAGFTSIPQINRTYYIG